MFYAVAVFGVVFLAGGLISAYLGLASRRWPTAIGTILSAEVKREVWKRSHGPSSIHFAPAVTYRYSVGGHEFQSDIVSSSGHLQRTEAEAKKIIEPFYPGGTVAVRYNPSNPSQAYLYPGVTGGVWGIILFAVATILVGVIGVLNGW